MSKLKLLTFDITNTLLKVKISPGSLYSEVAKSYGVNIHGSELDRVYPSTWQLKKRQHPNYGRRDGITTKQWWSGFVQMVFVNAGYRGSIYIIEEIATSLWDTYNEGSSWEVIPHTHECLSSMKNAGLRLGVISNFDERLQSTLVAHRLDSYFDFLVTSASVGVEKPDPAIFRFALGVSGVHPSEAGHVGDDLSHDYLAPKSIGMTAFLLDRDNKVAGRSVKGVDQKFVIRDLLELNRFVDGGELQQSTVQ